MALATGTRLGSYEILSPLGAGGMGEVYRAKDRKLKREVAIKVLPEAFARDMERMVRFQREAEVLALLNHSNIAQIYCVEDRALVMELVPGSSLKGPLPIETALNYARQIAEALEAAHERGIIHRDLKPANIMITPAGVVKVLDFGLAAIVQSTSSGAIDPADSPTLTLRATETGVIIGTAAYMSPEQARGKPVDKRADIWAFGVVLYEMVTGKNPFGGETVSDTIAAILATDPDFAVLPAPVRYVVERCLRKDPRRRWQDIGDLRIAIEELHQDSESRQLVDSIPAGRSRRVWPWVAGLVAIVGSLGAWELLKDRTTPTSLSTVPVTSYPGIESMPTLSPDGKQVAFVWDGEAKDNHDIYVTLVKGGSAPLRLTTDPAVDTTPAWSPDGSQIAFVRKDSVYLIAPLGGAERKVVDIAGTGTPVNGPVNGRSTSLAWSPDGKWLVVTDRKSDQYSPGATLVNVATGEKRYLTTPPLSIICDLHYAFSPDGSQLAFVRFENSAVADVYQVPIAGGEPVQLTRRRRAIFGLAWIPRTGDIMFAGQTNLLRMPARVGSEPSELPGIEGPIVSFAISQSGQFVYQRSLQDTNTWEQASGESVARQIAPSSLLEGYPQYSPDGARIAFASTRSGTYEIWVCDRNGKNVAQLTTLDAACHSPRWSPDGERLVFSCLKDDNRDIYTVRANGGGLRRLTSDPAEEGRPSFSRDGKWIYFYSSTQIWKMPVEGGPAIQVTREGGHEAIESWDGKTLYFNLVAGPGLRSVPVGGGKEKIENESVLPGVWDVTEKGIVYLGGELKAERHPILLWNASSGTTTQLGVIVGRLPSGGGGRIFGANHDASRFLWTQIDREESDLMLVENFLSARQSVP